MFILLHGADIVASRKRLEALRANYPDGVYSFVAKELDYSQLMVEFSTPSMFGEKRLLVLEGKVDSKQLNSKVVLASDADLVIWIGEKLRANDGLMTFTKEVKGTVEFFDEKADLTIFPFLDSVASRNRRASLIEYMKLLKSGSDPVYILTMLVWQFRNLLVPENSSGFVQKKAFDMQKNFSFDELRKIYYQLLQIDTSIKTGEADGVTIIEQFILKVTK